MRKKDDEKEKGMRKKDPGNKGSSARKGWKRREPSWRGRVVLKALSMKLKEEEEEEKKDEIRGRRKEEKGGIR